MKPESVKFSKKMQRFN